MSHFETQEIQASRCNSVSKALEASRGEGCRMLAVAGSQQSGRGGGEHSYAMKATRSPGQEEEAFESFEDVRGGGC